MLLTFYENVELIFNGTYEELVNETIGEPNRQPIGTLLIDTLKTEPADKVELLSKSVLNCLDMKNSNYNDFSPSQRYYMFVHPNRVSIEKSFGDIKVHFWSIPSTDLFYTEQEEILLSQNNGNKDKLNKNTEFELYKLLKNTEFQVVYIFESDNIYSLCYVTFIEMIKRNINIRKCKFCNEYFIITGRPDTEYCDKCREFGAKKVYKEKVKSNKLLELYNREYQRLYAKIRNVLPPLKDIKKEKISLWAKKVKSKIDEFGDIDGLSASDIEKFKNWLSEEGKKLEKELK